MKLLKYIYLILFALTAACSTGSRQYSVNQKKILPPDYGIYNGAFPDMGSTEDSVTFARLKAFENLTGKKPAWVYFSDNWFSGIRFPVQKAEIISDFGSVPFIRLMPRKDFNENNADPFYSLKKIADGNFDRELTEYANDVKKFGEPVMIEFGTEMNGDWFPWSGVYSNGNPGIFKNAYIRIIEIFRKQKAENVTWVFHVNYDSSPKEKWNTMADYYPGDEYIDWIGMSIYGAQHPNDEWVNISGIFETAYKELAAVSLNKPLAVFEFGVIENKLKPEWIKEFFSIIKDRKFSRIKGISYWHSNWDNQDGSYSFMRIDSSPESLEAYKVNISDNFFHNQINLKE